MCWWLKKYVLFLYVLIPKECGYRKFNATYVCILQSYCLNHTIALAKEDKRMTLRSKIWALQLIGFLRCIDQFQTGLTDGIIWNMKVLKHFVKICSWKRDTIHCSELGNAWFRRQQPAGTPLLLSHSAYSWLRITYNMLHVIGSRTDPCVSLMWQCREKKCKAWCKRSHLYGFIQTHRFFGG